MAVRRLTAFALVACLLAGLFDGRRLAAAERTARLRPPVLAGVFPPGVVVGTEATWTVTGRGLASVDRFVVEGEGVSVQMRGPGLDGRLSAVVRVALGAVPGFRALRVDGPAGMSNLLLFRVDTLPQLVEAEPNDEPRRCNHLAAGLAVAGVLEPHGLDHYVVAGEEGGNMTVEVESRRLGVPITPNVTVLSARGESLMHAGATPGLDGDCRALFRFPADGWYVIQVRDALYRGGPGARYRLRLNGSHVATGLFPLGGPAGQTIEAIASGGTLAIPRRQRITLPDRPGAVIEPAPFEGRGGAVQVVQRLRVGDAPEVLEASPGPEGGSSTSMALGTTANGRIDRPGEVDAYLVPVRRGERIGIAVEAAILGSWLDSVVSVRDARGAVVAENDDPPVKIPLLPGSASPGVPPPPPDSALEYDVVQDGTLRVEVADRFGAGGPEYAYRISVGPARPDFSVEFVPADAASDRATDAATGESAPEPEGVLNLVPGTSRTIRVRITPRGRTGPITVQAVGLPPGVEAETVTVRPTPGRASSTTVLNALLTVRAGIDAAPGLGELALVANAVQPDGTTVTRRGSTAVALTARIDGVSVRPVVHSLASLPVKVTRVSASGR